MSGTTDGTGRQTEQTETAVSWSWAPQEPAWGDSTGHTRRHGHEGSPTQGAWGLETDRRCPLTLLLPDGGLQTKTERESLGGRAHPGPGDRTQPTPPDPQLRGPRHPCLENLATCPAGNPAALGSLSYSAPPLPAPATWTPSSTRASGSRRAPRSRTGRGPKGSRGSRDPGALLV